MTTEAENAGQVVQQAVEATQQQSAAEIEAAKIRADEAAETARRISDAALQSDLGQRFQAQQQEFSTWRTETAQKIQTLEETNTQLVAGLGATTALLGSIQQKLTPVVVENPPQDQSRGTVQTDESSTGTGPNEKPKAVQAEQQPPPAPSKRRFL